MAIDIVADAGKITHNNYTASTTATVQTLPSKTTAILIQNTGSTNNLLISFDNGATYKTITPGQSLSLDIRFEGSYKQKSSASTTTVECVYASEA
jgi:hypothetical protein